VLRRKPDGRLRATAEQEENLAHLEQTESSDIVSSIEGEAVVDARRKNDEILGLDSYADPASVARVCGG
jgi:hypothetical protein